MKIDKEWLQTKSACAEGIRWFEDNFKGKSLLVDVLVKLAAKNCIAWISWLLKSADEVPNLAPLVDALISATMRRVKSDSADKTNSGFRGSAANSGFRGSAANSGDEGSAANSGFRGSAANSGYAGSAANSGDEGSAANSGYAGSAANSGDEGVAANFAPNGKVSGIVGTWIVCDEWEYTDKWHRIDMKCVKVDGEKIKPGIFYRLKSGQFVEAE